MATLLPFQLVLHGPDFRGRSPISRRKIPCCAERDQRTLSANAGRRCLAPAAPSKAYFSTNASTPQAVAAFSERRNPRAVAAFRPSGSDLSCRTLRRETRPQAYPTPQTHVDDPASAHRHQATLHTPVPLHRIESIVDGHLDSREVCVDSQCKSSRNRSGLDQRSVPSVASVQPWNRLAYPRRTSQAPHSNL